MSQYLQQLLQDNRLQPARLLEILRQIQSRDHFISVEAIKQVAQALNIPQARVISVIEFYSFLHLQPQGQFEFLFSEYVKQ